LVFVVLNESTSFSLEFRVNHMSPVLLLLSLDLPRWNGRGRCHIIAVRPIRSVAVHFSVVSLANRDLRVVLKPVGIFKTWLRGRHLVEVDLKFIALMFLLGLRLKFWLLSSDIICVKDWQLVLWSLVIKFGGNLRNNELLWDLCFDIVVRAQNRLVF
jgi:hypothetical protein